MGVCQSKSQPSSSLGAANEQHQQQEQEQQQECDTLTPDEKAKRWNDYYTWYFRSLCYKVYDSFGEIFLNPGMDDSRSYAATLLKELDVAMTSAADAYALILDHRSETYKLLLYYTPIAFRGSRDTSEWKITPDLDIRTGLYWVRRGANEHLQK
jgi:hypothetical protein